MEKVTWERWQAKECKEEENGKPKKFAKSKQMSISNIVNKFDIRALIVSETHLSGKKKPYMGQTTELLHTKFFDIFFLTDSHPNGHN